MPTENWTMPKEEIDKALELQTMIKESGISWPQLNTLLGLKQGTVHEFCRGHAPVPPQIMQRIIETLDGVKQGKIKPPIIGEQV